MTRQPLRISGRTDHRSFRTGVYGLAKCYNKNADSPAVQLSAPYYFRGTGGTLAPATGPINARLHENGNVPIVLSEEIELVLLAHREQYEKSWAIEEFTVGNDFTNLGVFRQDPALIMRAKAPTASIAQHWWSVEALANDITVEVRRIQPQGLTSTYLAFLGLKYLPFSLNELLSDLSTWNGIDLFEQVLIYTGAPRGFAWSGKPVQVGDTIEVVLEGMGVILRNLVEP